jgi:hypothetical protein
MGDAWRVKPSSIQGKNCGCLKDVAVEVQVQPLLFQ